jgi:hypothetical protein
VNRFHRSVAASVGTGAEAIGGLDADWEDLLSDIAPAVAEGWRLPGEEVLMF